MPPRSLSRRPLSLRPVAAGSLLWAASLAASPALAATPSEICREIRDDDDKSREWECKAFVAKDLSACRRIDPEDHPVSRVFCEALYKRVLTGDTAACGTLEYLGASRARTLRIEPSLVEGRLKPRIEQCRAVTSRDARRCARVSDMGDRRACTTMVAALEEADRRASRDEGFSAASLTPLAVIAAVVVGVGMLTSGGPGVTTQRELTVGGGVFPLTTTSWTDPASTAHLGDTLGGFMDHYSSAFELPEHMSLEVPETFNNAYYHSGRDHVKVPRNFTAHGQTKGLECSDAILSHELGHALFAHNMPALLPKGGPDWRALRFQGISTAFNELFADAAATGFLGDTGAVANALDFVGTGDDQCSANVNIAARDMKGAVLPDEWSERGPHNQLAPVRSAIGETYPELLETPQGVKKLLEILTEAMVAEHAEIQKGRPFSKDDVPARNRRVLALLERRMGPRSSVATPLTR